MVTMTNRGPVRRFSEKSSLLGVVEFRPRLAIVVIFLTIMIAVVGWRIFRESGAPRINAVADEAVAAFVAPSPEGVSSQPMDPGEAERRIIDISGVAVVLPRDVPGFVVSAVERLTIRKHPAAGVRFSFEGGRNLLIVFRKENFFGGKPRASFPDESLLSGERDGRSFVLWEREDASFIMVSDADVVQAFSLVRRFFT